MADPSSTISELENQLKEWQKKSENLEQHIRSLSLVNRQQTDLINLLMVSLPFGVVMMDENNTIVQMNRAAELILDKESSDSVGKKCNVLFNCLEQHNECPVLKGKALDRIETSCPDLEDKTFLRSAILNEDGSQPVVIEAFFDLTEKKQVEQQLVAASNAKDEFLGMISHELRTPLNSIMGYASLLHETFVQDDKESINKFAGNIEYAGQMLLKVVDGLLELSELTAKKIIADKLPIDISMVVTQIEYRMEKEFQEQGNKLVISEKGIKPFHQDLTVLMKILYELISNANKFTSNGKVALDIYTENVDDKVFIIFKVSDTGCGMTDETINEVFKMFAQADTSVSRLHNGMGLGLTITEKFVELLNGKIEVTSELGHGTEFKVTLPYEPVVIKN